MTDPSPWSRFDKESRARRAQRRKAAARARDRRRLYIVIALGVVVLVALVFLLWPHERSAAVTEVHHVGPGRVGRVREGGAREAATPTCFHCGSSRVARWGGSDIHQRTAAFGVLFAPGPRR